MNLAILDPEEEAPIIEATLQSIVKPAPWCRFVGIIVTVAISWSHASDASTRLEHPIQGSWTLDTDILDCCRCKGCSELKKVDAVVEFV